MRQLTHYPNFPLTALPVPAVNALIMADALSSTTPTVLHIEDDALWVEIIARGLSKWPEIRHVGSATNGYDGLALCREREPAIVLVDLWLPDIAGLAVVDQLNALPHPPRILLLSCRADEATLFRARTNAVAGLIWKSPRCVDHLRLALAAVAAGNRYLSPDVLEAVRRLQNSPNLFSKILSDHEIALLDDFADSLPNAAISTKRHLCEETVHSHRQHIMAKLGLHRTLELIRWAEDKGFGSRVRSGALRPAVVK